MVLEMLLRRYEVCRNVETKALVQITPCELFAVTQEEILRAIQLHMGFGEMCLSKVDGVFAHYPSSLRSVQIPL